MIWIQTGSDDELSILFLGDSYTIGESVPKTENWPSRLSDALGERGWKKVKPTVVAKTGWTTDELSMAIQRAELKPVYKLVTLSIGVNNQYRGRSASEFRTEIQGLIQTAIQRAGGKTDRVLLVNIPDWGVTPFAAGRDRAKIAKEIEVFNAVMQEEAQQSKVRFIDIIDISRRAKDEPKIWLAKDQLHPSGRMYEAWVERILPEVMDMLEPPQTKAVAMQKTNPFLQASRLDLEAPDFSAIRHEHYLPAFEAGMAQQLEQVAKIASLSESPTFENTLVALEASGEILRRVSAVFFNLSGAHTDDQIQAIEGEIAPKLAAHADNILLNSALFQRVESLWKSKDQLKLTEEQQRLLKEQYEAFVRAGARLSLEQQARVRSINEQLSSLTTDFQNNLLAVTQERSVIVDDLRRLEGMSQAEIAAAAEAAKSKGHDGKYLLQITNTTRQPILVSLNDRGLRREVWLASVERGLGKNGGIDNRPLVLQMAQLRAEKAELLGYGNHAAYALENQMAHDPAAAFKMLQDLVPQVVAKTRREADDIEQAMREDGIVDALEPWDWEYYAEKVRKQKYDVDESLVKPYFELDQVLKNGVFFTMNQLYGIEFRERFDLPVYHPTVRVFDVLDQQGARIGLFYADYYQRDSKRGGAWMDAFVSQSKLLGQLPVVVNVMNIPKAAEGEPTLLSFDHVTTMFHELGHGVHGLFSDVQYPSLSGTSVPRDFVEFPSTFHEDWAIDPIVLKNYAKHYQTGQPIPQELLEKSIAASKFNKGFDTLEYLSAALLDLAWHSLSTKEIPQDVQAFEAEALKRFGVDTLPVLPRYRTQYFAHVWSGGYSASYYAYLWSEVLAADAFAYMKKRGGLTRTNGQAYRNFILSRGGTREVMKQYVDFRNVQPTVDALLIRRGLKTAEAEE